MKTTIALLLVALACLLFVWGLGAIGLTDRDEGRNAEAGREMFETGDWITPTFNYEPRFIKLPDIMKAKRKPLDTIALDELGVEAAADLQVSEYTPPAARGGGKMVADAAELVSELKNRGLL